MLIRSLRIRNFRSCLDIEIGIDDLTAIVGANGCGKSTVLKALELFYTPTPRFAVTDFYNDETHEDIEISVTFGALSEADRDRFARYIQGEVLTVTRVLSWRDGRPVDRLHGERRQYSGFSAVRSAPNATEAKKCYNVLPELDAGELPTWTKYADAEAALEQWESAHTDRCVWERDDGQFFGFKEVAQGYLGRSTRLVFIPAIRDAADDARDGKGSVVAELTDFVVRRALTERSEFRKLVEDTRQQYRELFAEDRASEMLALSSRLTETLQVYVPDAAVRISWDPPEIALPVPRARVDLTEDGYATLVGSSGHGLQRALILTLLQHLAAAQLPPSTAPAALQPTPTTLAVERAASLQQTADEANIATAHQEDSVVWPEQNIATAPVAPIPNLVIVIEEPELFQHPSRQRHLAEILKALAGNQIPGVTERAQVVYCTHSPHFVGLDRFDKVRIFRKTVHTAQRPKVTSVRRTSLDEVAERLWKADGGTGARYSGESMRSRLAPLLTPWTSEGFFAEVAILVEGESDRAAILGTAMALGKSFESRGLVVIPCGGKSNIPTIAAVFQAFGITTYCLWDGDAGKGTTDGPCPHCTRPLDKRPDPKENHRLLRLLGATVEDWPGLRVEPRYACFAQDLETTMRAEINAQEFDLYLDGAQSAFGVSQRKHAIKNPAVLAAVLRAARADGRVATTLESVVRRIVALQSPVTTTSTSTTNGDVSQPIIISETEAHLMGEPPVDAALPLEQRASGELEM